MSYIALYYFLACIRYCLNNIYKLFIIYISKETSQASPSVKTFFFSFPLTLCVSLPDVCCCNSQAIDYVPLSGKLRVFHSLLAQP